MTYNAVNYQCCRVVRISFKMLTCAELFVNREMPDGDNTGSCVPGFADFQKIDIVEADIDSEYTSSLEYDPTGDHLICGTPPNLREKRRMKARSMNAKKAQERDIIEQLDRHKKHNVKDTKSRSYDRNLKQHSADTDSTSQVPSSSVPASSNVVKVDTHSRIMCLNPKPVIKQDGIVTGSDSQPVPRPAATLCYCPNDRYEFYRTFSTLIRLGSAPKKEKESKGGAAGSMPCSSPYSRQISTEQELWQTHLCDLIWFELQAYVNARTNKDQDDFLCTAREEIDSTLDKVMNFCANTGANSNHQFRTNNLAVECFCRKRQSGYSGLCLQQVIQRQRAVSEMVTSLLDDVESAESLYPTRKALADEHPMYADDKFQRRIATLCLWMTITRDIAHKLKLMAEVVHISDQHLVGTAWLCIDLASLQTLVSGYSSIDVDVCAANDSRSLPDDVRDAKDTEADDVSDAASVPAHVVLVQKTVHFEDEPVAHANGAQCQSEGRRGRPTSINEITPTTVYRVYVDTLLKKTGLHKLVVRLKELLDATLQRARLALLPTAYNCQHGISNISKVVRLTAFLSAALPNYV